MFLLKKIKLQNQLSGRTSLLCGFVVRILAGVLSIIECDFQTLPYFTTHNLIWKPQLRILRHWSSWGKMKFTTARPANKNDILTMRIKWHWSF